MDPDRLREHLDIALKTPDIRRAVAALERLRSALHILDFLPSPALEIVHAYVVRYCLPKAGAEGHFAKAYLELVDRKMAEAKQSENGLVHGITGREKTPL